MGTRRMPNDKIIAQAVGICKTAFLIVDANADDMPIIYSNEAFTELTGYEPKEVLGRNCRFLQEEDRDQPGLDTIRDALAQREACRVIVRNYRKDGSMFLNELTIAPLYDEPGKITHFVGGQNKVPYENLAQLRDIALARIERLTEREREILSMVVDGLSNKGVARALEISPRTAEKHRQQILRKMEVKSIAVLTRYAVAAEHGERPGL